MDAIQVRFKGSKINQGRTGVVLMTMKGKMDKRSEPVELLYKLYWMHDGRSDLPLIELWLRGVAGMDQKPSNPTGLSVVTVK